MADSVNPWWAETWTPSWAKHVEGKIAKRVVDEDGMPEPQKVEISCSICTKIWKGECTSGATRNLVARFAAAHVSCARDPLETPVEVEKGRR